MAPPSAPRLTADRLQARKEQVMTAFGELQEQRRRMGMLHERS